MRRSLRSNGPIDTRPTRRTTLAQRQRTSSSSSAPPASSSTSQASGYASPPLPFPANSERQGGTRDPINWIPRVAATKAALAAKGSIHLVHGLDVARVIIAVHFSSLPSSAKRGERYLVTDLRVYDWWDLVAAWGLPGREGSVELAGEQPRWVMELMEERGIRSLPRTPEELGRALDSSDFWRTFGIMPVRGRIERGRL